MLAEPTPVVVTHDALAPPPHTPPPPRRVESSAESASDEHSSSLNSGARDSDRLSFGEHPIVRLVRETSEVFSEMLAAQEKAVQQSADGERLGTEVDVVA